MLKERVTKHIGALLPFRNAVRTSRSKSQNVAAAASAAVNVPSTPLLVATPHPVSNIRVVKIVSDPGETKAERDWRMQWERSQLWHHQYWEANNLEFQSQKTEFEQNVQTLFGRLPSDEELSQFYREYLEATRARHAEYNGQLWKQNFANLLPALKAEISHFDRRVGAFIFEQPVGWWNEYGRARWRELRSATLSMLTIYKDGDTYGHRAQGVSVR
ncbi:hypothetical protein BJ742DRAFT_792195 [Cladochytrium replicatum]|nr:hypothetical protein BJ742DRAFT_792195 [Cladochytrium replicatum]